MKHAIQFLALSFVMPAYAEGPSLGPATNVVVTQTGIDEKNSFSEECKDFTLSSAQAQSFINNAAIVTQREIHDSFSTLPCFVRGTVRFHGYPANWEIRAGGTGSITLMSGEQLPIVDEEERDKQEELNR